MVPTQFQFDLAKLLKANVPFPMGLGSQNDLQVYCKSNLDFQLQGTSIPAPSKDLSARGSL